MAIVDMYQVTHEMTQLGKTVISVYHAERANPGELAANINDGFANSILPILRLQQDNGITNVELRCFNLGTSTDFHTQSLLSAPGLRVGAESPLFIAGAIRFPSLDRAVRSGQKRFPGMQETDYTAGALEAAANTLLENNADALIGNWLASSDSHHVCNYVIVKRVCETVDPVSGKCVEYRLPETDGKLVFYTPNARIVNQEISSQVSRKPF